MLRGDDLRGPVGTELGVPNYRGTSNDFRRLRARLALLGYESVVEENDPGYWYATVHPASDPGDHYSTFGDDAAEALARASLRLMRGRSRQREV